MTRLPPERRAELAGIWSPAHRGAFCPECGALAKRARTCHWEEGQRTRYHRCPTCGITFKSIETDPVALACSATPTNVPHGEPTP